MLVADKLYKPCFWGIILGSFLLWLGALLYSPWANTQVQLFFRQTNDFWADAANTTGIASNLNPYENDQLEAKDLAYPPLAYMVFHTLSKTRQNPPEDYTTYYFHPLWTLVFVLSVLGTLLLLYTCILQALSPRLTLPNILVALAFCVANPVLFTLERGNVVLLTSVLVMFFIFFYDCNIKWKKEMALLSLAAAAGLKITPALFGILLIYHKDWPAVIRTLVYGTFFFFAPFLFLHGGLQNLGIFLQHVHLHTMSQSTDFVNGTTLTNCFSHFIHFFHLFVKIPLYITLFINSFLQLFTYFSSGILLIGSYYLEDKWKQILNLGLVILLLPPVSQRYCLLYLFPAMVLFLKASTSFQRNEMTDWILTCFIILCIDYQCIYTSIFDFHTVIPILLTIALVYTLRPFHQFIIARTKK